MADILNFQDRLALVTSPACEQIDVFDDTLLEGDEEITFIILIEEQATGYRVHD